MEERRIIFCDIDGCVNSWAWYDEVSKLPNVMQNALGHLRDFDDKVVARLNQLTGSEVVMSTSWTLETSSECLKKLGLTLPIVGEIDHYELSHDWIGRGNCVYKWFQDNLGCIPYDTDFVDGWYKVNENLRITYVIIDDTPDMMLGQKEHFIHCDERYGFTDNDLATAKRILKIF